MSVPAAVMAFGIAAIISAALVEVIRRWALRKDILDHPDHRTSHTVPTPRGGGIAIVAVTLAGLALLQPTGACAALALPALAIAIVSWIDDVYGTPAALRFAVHLGAAIAAVVWFGGWRDLALPFIGNLHLGAFGVVITVIWIAGFTNAYNFMDGIDGIAGLQAVIAGIAWTVIAFQLAQPLIGFTAALIAGASAGFLFHNWSPARIFMGDVSSAFLGFVLALLAVIGPPLQGIALVWPFVFDSGFTMIRRALHREKIWTPHKSHLYQRLHQSGWSHARVSLLYGALALLGCITIVAPAAGVVVIASAAIALWAFVTLRERHVAQRRADVGDRYVPGERA